MRANPEPFDAIVRHDREGTVVIPDPHRPKLAYFLELERRVARVAHPHAKVLEREFLDILG